MKHVTLPPLTNIAELLQREGWHLHHCAVFRKVLDCSLLLTCGWLASKQGVPFGGHGDKTTTKTETDKQ